MKLLSHARHALFALLAALCLGGTGAAQNVAPSARESGERLVDAIIQVESQGDPQCVGRMGERGLMQIRAATWRAVTREIFGRPQPFQKAFDPALNRRVGRAYLAQLQEYIAQHRARWQADELSLLIAAYNAGPTCLRQKGFSLKRLPESTRDYVERVRNLHAALLITRTAQVRSSSQTSLAQM
jgi:soluble lytic murein transglycosylase-like protein